MLLADLPVDAVGGVPLAAQIGLSVAGVLVVLAVMRWAFWWLVGSKERGYRPRRLYRRWKPGQRRPDPEVLARRAACRIPDDDRVILPPMTALPAVPAAAPPYRWHSRRDPLVTCLRCEKAMPDCGCHEEVLSRG